MPTRKKSTLLAQGKERRLDGGRQSWRVRLYATDTGFPGMFKAPDDGGTDATGAPRIPEPEQAQPRLARWSGARAWSFGTPS
jgi:hypothetical protein